jgi:hypothetical protein
VHKNKGTTVSKKRKTKRCIRAIFTELKRANIAGCNTSQRNPTNIFHIHIPAPVTSHNKPVPTPVTSHNKSDRVVTATVNITPAHKQPSVR